MYLKYQNSGMSAHDYILATLRDYKGSFQFLLACEKACGKDGQDLVGFVSTIKKYHRHKDFTLDSLVKSMAHFKNLAYTYLDEGDYEKFRSWMNNWADLRVVVKIMSVDKDVI